MNETRELARFLVKQTYDDLPHVAIDKAKELTLDQLGIQLAASVKPWCLSAYNYIKKLRAPGRSTIVNYGDKVAAESATFVNATFGHGFEIDDVHKGAGHVGAISVATSMALAERERASGWDYLAAVVLGCESMGRIGWAVRPSLPLKGFHAMPVVGTFGAAAAAGKLLKLDEEHMVNALSIAGSSSSGLLEYSQTGGEIKRVHAGISAHGGLRAALLAAEGLTGPPTVLEGVSGFCKAFSDTVQLEEITKDLGKKYVINDIAYKRHCCNYFIHAPIDALLKIVEDHKVRREDIAAILVGTHRLGIRVAATIREPKDISSAQFSIPFSLGMTLVLGSNSFKDYVHENLPNKEILAIAQKVKVELDPDIDGPYPGRHGGKVAVTLKDGRRFVEQVDYPRGTTENPMTRKECEDKFRGLASMVTTEDRIEKIIKAVNRLDKAASVVSLTRLLVLEK